MLKRLFIPLTLLLPLLAAGEPAIVHHEMPDDWLLQPGSESRNEAVLTFTALGRGWRLELTENSRLTTRLGGAGRQKLASGLTLYQGRIAGEPDSWLRLTEDPAGRWQGMLWDGRELYAVEPADAVATMTELPVERPSGPVVFRLADLRLPPDAMACASGPAPGAPLTAKAGYEALVAELTKTATSQIDIAVIGDAAFNAAQSDPVTALATRLNNIDGIFSEQVGVAINVTEFRVFDAADDPLTDSTDAVTLLTDLGRYKSSDAALSNLGLVHLYTGRDVAGTNNNTSTAGIAYTGALCSSRFGAGLSEARRTVTIDSLIGAHEIGHNFGAPHDGEDGSECESTPETFLMAARLNGSSTFSACSLEQMAPEIAAASCLRPVTDADMATAAIPSAQTVLEGESLTLDVSATNLGTETAAGVSLRITLPGELSLVDPGTPCVSAAGGADCFIGNVAAGGSFEASLGLDALAAGTVTIRSEVSADADRDATNDSQDVVVRIDPAADLGVTLNSPVSLVSGATGSLTVEVANASERTATDVVLTVTLPDTLRPDSASPAGDCTVGATGVVCTSAALAGGDLLTVDLAVTAVRTGGGAIRVSVAATEGDPDESDNESSKSIQVSSAVTTGGGGGGGGSGLWVLLALVPVLAARRRR